MTRRVVEIGLLLVVGAAIGLLLAVLAPLRSPPSAVPVPVSPRGDLAPSEQTTIELFEAARDSVVSITTAREVFDPWTRSTQNVPRGTGSGFVWDEAGHIVTNHHVIAGASAAQIRLADGRTFRAGLVGAAPAHDLAVLRIRARQATPAPLPIGRSGDLQVGQTVLAIGNPFGLDWTLTTGVVSALGREIPTGGGDTIEGLIQTDAAINPGNSGGPLIDSAGRLIGVNTAIYSPSGSSAGIGCAVPVDVVHRVVPRLIVRGRYSAPVLGVMHDERVNLLGRRNGIEGVLVLGVQPGSPAQAAGLEPAGQTARGRLVPGDVIVGLGGRPVVTSDDLMDALDAHRPGEVVALELERNGKRRTVDVELAAPS